MAFRRSVAIVGIVLAWWVGTIPAASAATQDANVPVVAVIYAPGQAPVTDATTIGALQASCPTSAVDPAQYGPGGVAEPATQPSTQEWALATVLAQCLPTAIPLSSVTQVTVLQSDGQPDLNQPSQLTPPDLTLPSDFADSSQWPVFWDAGSAVIYERPSRSTGDDNGQDQVTVDPDQSLQFDVFEGSTPVSVAVTASPSSVAAGGSVTFTATVSGASGTSADTTFVWNFGGGAPAATGSPVTATFATAGNYLVTVQASGAEQGFGQISLDVGSTPAPTGTTTTPTGPAAGSGTTPGVSGTLPGAGTHKLKHKDRPKRKPTGAGQTTTPRAVATVTAPLAAPAPASAVTAVKPVSATGPVKTGSGATVRATGKGRRKVKQPPASGPAASAKRTDTEVVQGRVLGSLSPAAPGAGSAQSTRSGGAPRVNRPAGAWPWGSIVGGLTVVALLGLGAGRELRAIRFAP